MQSRILCTKSYSIFSAQLLHCGIEECRIWRPNSLPSSTAFSRQNRNTADNTQLLCRIIVLNSHSQECLWSNHHIFSFLFFLCYRRHSIKPTKKTKTTNITNRLTLCCDFFSCFLIFLIFFYPLLLSPSSLSSSSPLSLPPSILSCAVEINSRSR